MNTANKNTCSAELLSDLYRNMKMGSNSIVDLLPKVEDRAMREEMTSELNQYEKFTKEISSMLNDMGVKPTEEGFMARMGAKMGIAMNTMTDSTSSHIAQMMIEGATMGITENTKLIREYENKQCSEAALRMGRDTVKFMENSVEKLKSYL